MLFEAFMVFYLLEILVLISAFVLYSYKPKKLEKKIYNPWGFWNDEK